MESTAIAEQNPRQILKAPSSEKPRLTANDRLAANMTEMATTLTELASIIRYYPESPKHQLLGYFERTTKTPLTPAQTELINLGLDIYEKRHQAVKNVRQQYPDDSALYNYLFGATPKGKIEIIQGPVTLYFRCHNLSDYALIHNAVFDKSSKKPSDNEARKTSGVALHDYPVPELKNSIIAENALGLPFDEHAQRVLTHEEQHQIMTLFREAYTDYLPNSSQNQQVLSTIKKIAQESLPSDFHPDNMADLAERFDRERDVIKKGRLIVNFLRQRRQTDEAHAKDEILAFFQEGDSIHNIEAQLFKTAEKSGLYDFSDKKSRAIYAEDLVRHLGKQYSAPIKQLVEDILVNEYHASLRQAFNALSTLSATNLLREHIVNMLMNIPLSRWKAVAKLKQAA